MMAFVITGAAVIYCIILERNFESRKQSLINIMPWDIYRLLLFCNGFSVFNNWFISEHGLRWTSDVMQKWKYYISMSITSVFYSETSFVIWRTGTLIFYRHSLDAFFLIPIYVSFSTQPLKNWPLTTWVEWVALSNAIDVLWPPEFISRCLLGVRKYFWKNITMRSLWNVTRLVSGNVVDS